MTNKEMTERECEYCELAKPLVIGNSDDKGISLMHPNILSAYGYDIHGSDSNGLCVKINYCPMCGRELKVKQMTNKGMTNEEAKTHIDMLIAHKDKALKTHPYFNGATNGDVMQAIFPRTKFYKNLTYIYTEQDKVICDLDWWNAPYREGDAEC